VNEQQRRFVAEFVKCLNGAEAARRAGYSARRAGNTATRLLAKPDIRAAIDQHLAARERRMLVTADRVLEEFARIAFADIRNYARWGPDGIRLRPPEEIDAAHAAAIAEIVAPGGAAGRGARIKLYDKKAALEALARHLGLFEPRAAAVDPKARHEAAAKLRQMLMARIAALAAAPDKPPNGDDS
jgi:phage terminase small subunit